MAHHRRKSKSLTRKLRRLGIYGEEKPAVTKELQDDVWDLSEINSSPDKRYPSSHDEYYKKEESDG